LAQVEAASGPGDTIYILQSTKALDGGIVLKDGQRLIGKGKTRMGRQTTCNSRITNSSKDRNNGRGVVLSRNNFISDICISDTEAEGMFLQMVNPEPGTQAKVHIANTHVEKTKWIGIFIQTWYLGSEPPDHRSSLSVLIEDTTILEPTQYGIWSGLYGCRAATLDSAIKRSTIRNVRDILPTENAVGVWSGITGGGGDRCQVGLTVLGSRLDGLDFGASLYGGATRSAFDWQFIDNTVTRARRASFEVGNGGFANIFNGVVSGNTVSDPLPTDTVPGAGFYLINGGFGYSSFNAEIAGNSISVPTGSGIAFQNFGSVWKLNLRLEDNDILDSRWGLTVEDMDESAFTVFPDIDASGNRIFRNRELNVYSKGYDISAEDNWWGSADLLDVQAGVSSSDGHIDFTPYLTVDPRGGIANGAFP